MLIKDFSAGYSYEEDRLIFEVRCDEGAQTFWLTRRAVTTLNEAISRVLIAQYEQVGHALGAPQHVYDFAHFGHADASEKLKISGSSHDQDKSITNAILVYEVGYQVIDQNVGILKLANRDGEGFQYRFARDVLHGLLNLLASQANKAGWALSFPLLEQTIQSDVHPPERLQTLH